MSNSAVACCYDYAMHHMPVLYSSCYSEQREKGGQGDTHYSACNIKSWLHREGVLIERHKEGVMLSLKGDSEKCMGGGGVTHET